MKKENKKNLEEWLDERFEILLMSHATRADESYYKGALKALEFVGHSWERDKTGKHKVI